MGIACWTGMGACASSSHAGRKIRRSQGSGGSCGGDRSLRWPSTVPVIHVDGRVQELDKQAIPAAAVTAQNPGCYLCSSESMAVGLPAPPVPDEEELRSGQVYFLLPKSRAQSPLSLPELCDLTIKASAILASKNTRAAAT